MGLEREIENVAEFIGEGLRKYWRVPVRQYKEKYWSVRVYCSLGWYQVHDITHPGWTYSRYSQWLWILDCRYGPYLCTALNYIVIPIHKYAYRRQYRLALLKWPHLRNEILQCADFHELLGGL